MSEIEKRRRGGNVVVNQYWNKLMDAKYSPRKRYLITANQ